MTDDTNDTFETDSEPGEQAYERTVEDAVAFIEKAYAAAGNWCGERESDIVRSCVRASLESTGTASPKKIARAARKLDEDDAFDTDAPVESVLLQLEAMIGEKKSDATSLGGI